jgi:group I intron endonuclease
MFYLIYKITNQINGKFYIGSHKTKDLNDNYMGSGKYLLRAQKKHGIENFAKEILFVFDNPEEMYAKESEIVNEDFLEEQNCYNIKIGGFGGWDYINNNVELRVLKNKKARNTTNDKIKQKYGVSNSSQIDRVRQKASERMIKLHAEGKFTSSTSGFIGKKHSEKSKQLISFSAKERMKDPTNNPSFGTRWIWSDQLKISKKILKDDPLSDGWNEGRKIKWNK